MNDQEWVKHYRKNKEAVWIKIKLTNNQRTR